MRYLSSVLPRALAVALTLCLASVTATAVAGNGSGDSGTSNSGTRNNGTSNNGAGNAGATPPETGSAAPDTPPGQAKKPESTAPVTPPGQAAKTTPATTTTTPDGTTTTPADQAAPTALPPAVAPVMGESMGITRASGTVHVRLPGSTGYVSLAVAGSVPPGAVVDARHGTVVLRSAIDAKGGTQAATIRGAVFEVRQSATGKGLTDLLLKGGRPKGCPAPGTPAVARAAMAHGTVTTAKRKQDRLWARDNNGRFRTRGRNSVATVRGTRWSTRETCAGTLTRVMDGAVDVFDMRTHRTARVRAGHTYLARTSG